MSREVRMTEDGKYLVFSTRESHVGPRGYFYETDDLNCASLFDSSYEKRLGIRRSLDESERTKFNRSIPVPAREERKVVLVHPDEKEPDDE